MAKLVKKEKLVTLLASDDPEQDRINHKGLCYCCGTDFTITIEKTSKGYGLQGGVFYESDAGQLLMQCESCFNNIEH